MIAAVLETVPGWLKWLHVLGMVIYAGGFLALTRLVGHAVRFESAQSREDAYRIFKRMHKFVDWGGLAIMVGTGLYILLADPAGKAYLKQGYFHMKLTFVILLLVCDIVFTKKLFSLQAAGPQPKKALFMALHGVAGLLLVGTLVSVFVVGSG